MPAYYRRTQFLYDVLRDHPLLRVNPAQPQANMLHIHLPVSRDRAHMAAIGREGGGARSANRRAQQNGNGTWASAALVLGFILMTVLDTALG